MSVPRFLPVIIVIACFSLPLQAEEGVDISFKTDPPIEQIRPDDDVVKLSFKVTRKDGRPLQAAQLHIELDAPPKNAFFSTEAPIVEGTKLLDVTCVAPKGELDIVYLFPIRGEYRLKVTAESTATNGGAFRRTSMLWNPRLNEVPSDVRNFWILISILVGFGVVSGMVLGRSAKRKAMSGENP